MQTSKAGKFLKNIKLVWQNIYLRSNCNSSIQLTQCNQSFIL
jgi:hypothetical protein